MEENFIENFINNLLQNRKIKGDSIRWANWISKLTLFTCKPCAENHGKIFDISILKSQYDVTVKESYIQTMVLYLSHTIIIKLFMK